MSPESESIATRVARRVQDFQMAVAERVEEELSPGPGLATEERRRLRREMRLMVMEGDEMAQEYVERLALENGHVEGEPIPCPVCVEAYELWQDLFGGE